MKGPTATSNVHKLPLVSCIVPTSRPDLLRGLVEALEKQDYPNKEVIVEEGYRNPSAARNRGAERASGEIFAFIDDDVIIPATNWLTNLVLPLLAESADDIGLVSSGFLLPPDATKFERSIARQFDRIEFSPVEELTESDLAGANCLAIKKKLFQSIGGWDEGYVTSEDNEMRERLRQLGLKPYMAPQTLIYHPRPKTLTELTRKYVWYYFNSAMATKSGADTLGYRRLNSVWRKAAYIAAVAFGFLADLIYWRTKRRFAFRPLYAYVILVGRLSYLWAWIR